MNVSVVIKRNIKNIHLLAMSKGGYLLLFYAGLKKIREKGIVYTLKSIFLMMCEVSRGRMNLIKQYQIWLNKYDVTNIERITKLRESLKDFERQPLISILMPVYNPEIQWLEKLLNLLHNKHM